VIARDRVIWKSSTADQHGLARIRKNAGIFTTQDTDQFFCRSALLRDGLRRKEGTISRLFGTTS